MHPPKTIITTSRNPTQTTRTLCNDLTHSIPNSLRINRGKSNLDTLAEKALEQKAEKVIISDRWKSGLGKIQFFEIDNTGLVQFYPMIYVKGVKLRRTFKNAQTKTIKSLVLQTKTKIPFEAHKLADALSHFFNIPKISSEETLSSNSQVAMHISLNTAHRLQITFLQAQQRIEIGPQIIVSHLIWKPQK